MTKVEIKINVDTKTKLDRVAAEAGLSADKLADVLLSTFLEHGGKIFTGNWKEGPGIRFLPDWPRFSSGVVKIRKEDMR